MNLLQIRVGLVLGVALAVVLKAHGLQQVHARFPFVVTWDDHELTNDAWHGGAQNHSEDEGSWNQRKMWAVRAYYEWMPIREPAVADQQWRALEIGDLATLIMLETRLSARDRQPSLGDAPLKTVALDLSNPDQPRLAQDGTSAAATRVVDLPFDVSQSPPVPLTDPAQILALSREEELPPGLDYLPDVDRLEAELLNDPARQLLGETQRSFIRQQLEESAKQNKTWQIIGNQTLLTPVTAPDVSNAYSEEEFAALPSYVSEFIPWTSQGIPLGTDSWNGYGAERSWFLGEAAKNGSNIVVLTGDTHAAWGMNLEGPGSWQGIELGTTSISSPGFPQSFSLPADAIESRLKAANPQLRYSEVTHRGYLTLTLTADDARVTFHRVSDVKTRQFDVDRNHRFVLTPGSGNGVRWS
ncbi:MAG: alkaline phosphatase D family protein [Pseudomonadota bacterium]